MAHVLAFPRSEPLPSATIANLTDTFIDDALHRRGVSANTARSYRSDMILIARALPQPISAITRQDLEAFLMGRDEKPATTNRRIAALKQFFRWVRREGYLDSDPAQDLESKSQAVALPRPIPATDLRILERAIKALPREAIERLIFTILRETGMRADEVLSLNVGDVILESGREALRVVEPKNKHDRITVLTDTLMAGTLRGLRRHLRQAPTAAHAPLFVNRSGRRLTYDVLHTRWQALLVSCDLVDDTGKPRYTIHQLRHTAGSQFVQQFPEEVVSRMLGHRDPKSTRVYADLNEDQIRAELMGRKRR